MPKYHFFSILTCMACLFYISCEKTGYPLNKNEISNSQAIINRAVDECEDCPDEDDCCCGIELRNPNDVISLQLCGTSDGASACSGGSNCGSSFSGGGQVITLQSGNSQKLFCMGQGNAFWIKNLDMSNSASFYLTCQYDLTSPQILSITIPANTTWYYEANTSCVLSDCQ